MDKKQQEQSVTGDVSNRDKSLTRNTGTGTNIVNFGIVSLKNAQQETAVGRPQINLQLSNLPGLDSKLQSPEKSISPHINQTKSLRKDVAGQILNQKKPEVQNGSTKKQHQDPPKIQDRVVPFDSGDYQIFDKHEESYISAYSGMQLVNDSLIGGLNASQKIDHKDQLFKRVEGGPGPGYVTQQNFKLSTQGGKNLLALNNINGEVQTSYRDKQNFNLNIIARNQQPEQDRLQVNSRNGREIKRTAGTHEAPKSFTMKRGSKLTEVPSFKKPYQNSMEFEDNFYLDSMLGTSRNKLKNMDTISDNLSETNKRILMPNIQASKVELQEEIGCLIQKPDSIRSPHPLPDQEGTNGDQPNEKFKNPTDQFFKIIDKDKLEIINDYKDRFPCLKLRKAIMKLRVYINRTAFFLIKNPIFESISIMVIVSNSIFLAIDDPLATVQPSYITMSDYVFQSLYTTEMILKIIAYGFILNQGSYLRDAWNVLDFIIIVSGFLGYILQGGGVNLSVLRSFRVIRPLRTISSIQGLRIIVHALLNSMPLLRDTILVLLFFFLIFGIAGLSLFQGAYLFQCYSIETGILLNNGMGCGGEYQCPAGYNCGKTSGNPNFGTTNFDNICWAVLQVFQTVTMEGWTSNMLQLWQSTGIWIIMYFYLIVYIGAFFLLNLTLAVITSKFSEEHEEVRQKKLEQRLEAKKKAMLEQQGEKDHEEEGDGNDFDDQMPGRIDFKSEMKRIEEDPDLSPRSRKIAKEKLKMQMMMLKIDSALAQREIKDRVNPMNASLALTFTNESIDNAHHRWGSTDQSRKYFNYGQLFNQRSFIRSGGPSDQRMILNDSINILNHSSELNLSKNGMYIERQIMSGQNTLVNQSFAQNMIFHDPIKEENQEGSVDGRSYRHQELQDLKNDYFASPDQNQDLPLGESIVRSENAIPKQKPVFSPWLGQVFEISKQPQNEDQPQSARLLMGGFAGLRVKSFEDEDEYDKIRQAIHDRVVAENELNVFKFDHEGDDELSNGDHELEELIGFNHESDLSSDPSRQRHRRLDLNNNPSSSILGDEESNSNQPVDGESPTNEQKFVRKSTMATVDTRGVARFKYHTNHRSQRTNQNSNLSETGFINIDNQPQNEHDEMLTFSTTNLKLEAQRFAAMKPPKLLRLQTNSPIKLNRRIESEIQEGEGSDEDNEFEEEVKQQLGGGKKDDKKDQPKGVGFKEKALALFKGCGSKKKPRKNEKSEKFNLKQEIKLLKEEATRRPRRAESPRLKSQRSKSNKVTAQPTHHHQQEKFQAHHRLMHTPKPQSQTPTGATSIRGRSEERKVLKLQKQHERFKKQEANMRKRRDRFFADAIEKIGVNQEDMIDEMQKKYKEEREIKLNDYFKITKQAQKQYLTRSGSADMRKMKERNKKREDKALQFEGEEKVLSQVDQDEFEEDVKKIKMEIFNKQDQKKVIPNMDEVLIEKKSKLAIKMNSIKYPSAKDIFELRKRTITDDAEEIDHMQAKRQVDKPYRKKVMMTGKKYFAEPVIDEDQIESDDNQDEMLKKLEDNYNVDHRSNIHVTGTLSLVINKPHAENKMMNKNYYANFKAQQLPPLPKITEEALVYEAFSRENNLSDNDSVKINSARSHQLRANARLGDQSRDISADLINPGLTVPGVVVQKNKFLKHSAKSSYTAKNQSLIKKQMARLFNSQLSTDRRKTNTRAKSIIQDSANKQSNQGSNYPIMPRPEPLNDKQILKRLNKEMARSHVFSSIYFKKLPEQITRKKGEIVAVEQFQTKKKNLHKKKQSHHHNDNEGDDEHSDSSVEQSRRQEDYFLDRKGLSDKYQIDKARSVAISKNIDNVEWSGQDIIQRLDPYKARIALNRLSMIRVWPKGIHGYIKRCRVPLKNFMKSSFVDNFMTCCVLANTVVLAMDYYGISDQLTNALQTSNVVFTIIFGVEMFFKITGFGIVKYLKDRMNYMDGTIVILSFIELIFMSGQNALGALKSIRIIRMFRVLRLARLLRGMKSMMHIINVISRSITSIFYLAILMFLFVFIYALLGMQFYGGNFPFLDGSNRYSFDTFNYAFVTTFDLLTVENWNNSLFNAMGSGLNPYITAIYFVSAIFIGNYILLNLFLAILLDGFTQVEEEEHETVEKREARNKQRLEDLKIKEGEEFIHGMEDIEINNGMNTNTNKKRKKKKKKAKKQASEYDEEPINNILDESVEIDNEALVAKKEADSQKKEILFKGIECERSLYIFSKAQLSDKFDTSFTVFFAFEMSLKWIAFGVLQDRNSYIRDTWNQLDGFIVFTSLIDAALTNVNLPIIKILRILRILRPLRFLSHSSSMKTLVVALIQSMSSIFNVGVVILVVFLMFAILGENLFAGKLQLCTINKYVIDNQDDCFKARGEWVTYNQNFDNVIRGMITLFVVSNQEGWPDVMYMYTDITGVGTGPKQAVSTANAYFFVLFEFIGNFFLLNLFVGVLFMNFEAAQRDEREAMLLDGEELKWVDMMKMICNSKPEIIKTPKNPISRYFYAKTKPETKFDMFIMLCIILNMISMAMNYEGQSLQYSKALDNANYCFTGAFILEAILKMIGNGWAYFIPGWNKFDFFVVCSSMLDIIINQLSANSLKFLKVAPQIARVLRVLRVSRLFRLLNKAKGLKALIQTIIFSLPALFNAFALLMLSFFIFAVLGVFLFRNITEGIMLDPVYMNFTDFHHAIIILIRMSTGEDWPTIMYDTMQTIDCIPNYNCGYPYSPIFFIIFVIVVQYVMLNLFVLIIVQQFELYYLPQDNILQEFSKELELFKLAWARFSKEHEGIKVKSDDLIELFKSMDGKVGMKDENDKTVLRNIVKMNLEADADGFIYFNELLFKTMKRQYGKERTKKRILAEVELQALDKLHKIKESQIKKSRGKERVKAVTVNPFLAVMYKNMSFKAWLKQYNENKDLRNKEKEYDLSRESGDEEYIHNEEDYWMYKTEEDVPATEEEDNDQEIEDKESQGPQDEEIVQAHEVTLNGQDKEDEQAESEQEQQISIIEDDDDLDQSFKQEINRNQ